MGKATRGGDAGKKSAIARTAARSRRERALVDELQRDHDWMFFHLPRKADRETMLFKRATDARGRRTHSLIPGLKVMVAMPSTSPIAVAMQDAAKAKEQAKDRAKKSRETRRARRASKIAQPERKPERSRGLE